MAMGSEAPPPLCVAEDTMHLYDPTGTCTEGVCQYEPHLQTSTSYWFGAELNPTGAPVGGRWGYPTPFAAADADHVVATKAELLFALASALTGEVVFVDPNASIDMSGETRIEIPGGVTLASARGQDNHPGALLFADDTTAFPLFLSDGPGVRVTGLRLRASQAETSVLPSGNSKELQPVRAAEELPKTLQGPFLDLADAFLGYAVISADAQEGLAVPVVVQAEAPRNHRAFAFIKLTESLQQQTS